MECYDCGGLGFLIRGDVYGYNREDINSNFVEIVGEDYAPSEIYYIDFEASRLHIWNYLPIVICDWCDGKGETK